MKTESIVAVLLMSAMTSVSLAAPSSTTRTVVLEKIDTGAYRWKITRASVPEVGDRQVLVRVRAVALNRLDLDELEPSSGADKSGRVPGYDAAGDVVAVGEQVKDFRPGMRVTSLYFENWVDGRFDAKVLERVRGWTIDGVLSDYDLQETSFGATVGVGPGSRQLIPRRPHPPITGRTVSPVTCRRDSQTGSTLTAIRS